MPHSPCVSASSSADRLARLSDLADAAEARLAAWLAAAETRTRGIPIAELAEGVECLWRLAEARRELARLSRSAHLESAAARRTPAPAAELWDAFDPRA